MDEDNERAGRTVDIDHAGVRPVARRRPQLAELVWRRAVSVGRRRGAVDAPAVALELLRAARGETAAMSHACMLGNTRLRAHAADDDARAGLRSLRAAIAFLGAKPRDNDIEPTEAPPC